MAAVAVAGTPVAPARRARLGENLVAFAPMPLRDPVAAMQTDPVVPENQRFCVTCHEPVGRARDGQPGRTQGFCSQDGTRYSFVPALAPGDLIDNRYEILGALAHGGLGWIYVGRDRNISDASTDRWVVLKGLINSGDADAMAAAVAERRFLVEVDHPGIVKIHDFASHPDPATGDVVGYIVMEYVGGRSLRDLALHSRDADGNRTPLPLPQVLAYGIGALPALGHLHDRGLLCCDFKPDNVIHVEDQLKLIDLGAVRRVDDERSAIYGTPGYQAPEVGSAGPSVASDLYTVGRTLAVLSFDFGGFSTRYADTLPARDDVALLAAQESYFRLLRRATHRDPPRRFGSASEMADQLLGVLREVLSAADHVPRPSTSGLFSPGRRTFGPHVATLTAPDVAASLPLPLVDPTDPGAALLATLTAAEPRQTIRALAAVERRTVEVSLALTRAYLEADDIGRAANELRAAAGEGPMVAAAGSAAPVSAAPGDWRLDWYRGLIALANADIPLARQLFDDVYAVVPGEIAARLAFAAASELDHDITGAQRLYERVWRVDHEYPSAAFGLARTLAAADDHGGAIAVLDEVPEASIQYVAAQIAALRLRLVRAGDAADLVDASARLERLRLDAEQQATLAVEMFRAALAWLGVPLDRADAARRARIGRSGRRVATAAGRVLDQPLTERDLRLGLERAYRALAAMQSDTLRRYALVDRANAVRPWTMF
jgi:serine/threonine-protein kinase PknG